MIVTKCDLCGRETPCQVKEIEGNEYDICRECWDPLEAKLKGKGRPKKREMVLLPQPARIEKPEEPKPLPGEPPKIWCH